MFVKKQPGTKCLGLGTRRHRAIDDKMRKELLNLLSCHFARMAFVVKEDEPPHPINMRQIGAVRVVFRPQDIRQLDQ